LTRLPPPRRIAGPATALPGLASRRKRQPSRSGAGPATATPAAAYSCIACSPAFLPPRSDRPSFWPNAVSFPVIGAIVNIMHSVDGMKRTYKSSYILNVPQQHC